MKRILVIGARGLAKEILYSFPEIDKSFVFFDDINENIDLYKGQFIIIDNINDIGNYFDINNFNFIIGVGLAKNRKILLKKFSLMKGNPITLISKLAKIGKYDNKIGKGVLIFDGVQITNSVTIGNGTLINKGTIISHDVIIGKYCDISPGVKVMGHVHIGDNVNIGAGATIIPKISIGNNVTIGAGAVVVKNIPNNVVVIGNPAKVLRKIKTHL